MKLPVVVLTGFLGAGKTTLLNRVLAARAAAGDAGGKLAIIVNELGAIGVDAELLPRGAARQVELPGGCVCCVLNDALDAAIVEILEANPGLEMLILETTGVAEPVPIVWTLERPPLASRLRVAAVVTLVDPTSWVAARATSAAAEIQVESADVVLVTKRDVAKADERAAARAAIAALAPSVPVLELGGDEAAAWLLATLRDPAERGPRREIDHAGHAHAADDGDHAGHAHAGHDGEDAGHEPAGHAHAAHDGDDAGREHAGHEHAGHDGEDAGHAHAAQERERAAGAGRAHGVDSVALPIEATVDLEAFEEAVAALPAAFFRVKAIVHAIDGRTGAGVAGWAAVHRVGLRVSSEPIAAPLGSGRVVGLGPGVTAAPLAACVAAAVLRSGGDRDAAR